MIIFVLWAAWLIIMVSLKMTGMTKMTWWGALAPIWFPIVAWFTIVLVFLLAGWATS